MELGPLRCLISLAAKDEYKVGRLCSQSSLKLICLTFLLAGQRKAPPLCCLPAGTYPSSQNRKLGGNGKVRGMALQKGGDIELLCPVIGAFELEPHPFSPPRGATCLCLSVISGTLAHFFRSLSRRAVGEVLGVEK